MSVAKNNMFKLSVSALKDAWAVFVYRIRLFKPRVRIVFMWSLLTTFLVLCFAFYGLYLYCHDRDLFLKLLELYGITWRLWFIQWVWKFKALCHGVQFSYAPVRSIAEEFVHHQLFISSLWGISAGIMVFLITFWRANKTSVETYKKTLEVGSPEWTRKNTIKTMYATQKASSIKLMDLPLVKNTETGHILIIDEQGENTTCVFQNMMGQLRTQKAIIVSSRDTLLDKDYDPSCDIVMNPFDSRFPGWDIGGECTDVYHCDELAKQLILPSQSDRFLTEPARLLFSGIVHYLRKENQCSVEKIFEYVSTIDLKTLHAKFANTDIAGFINPKSEKSAENIRNHIAASLACLEPLARTAHDKPFSIRQWIQDPDQKGWLFIQATPGQWPRLKSLFSCFLSIAMKTRREHQSFPRQRVWFMIEDLACLDKLPELLSFLVDGDKHNTCMVLGVHDIPRLGVSYGHHITQSLFDACATKVLFRCSALMAGKYSELMWTPQQRGKSELSSPYALTHLPDSVSLVQLPHGHPIMQVKWNMP